MPNNPNRTFQISKWPLTDENDKIIGIIGLAIEITDKIKLKKIIDRCERNFMDMSNNIDELIVIRDEHKALYVSPYFKELYGFDPDPLYEDINYWRNYWDKLEYEHPREEFSDCEITKNKIRVYKEGKIDKWVESKFVPVLDEVGNVIRKIGIVKDITEQKHIDDEIEELRMEFFANISHELRTPINIIMSALQVTSLTLNEDGKKAVGKYINLINQNSLRLLRLVNNLIDSTKISSGNFTFHPMNCDIVSFTEEIVSSVVEFVEKNNLEIVFDTDIEEKIIAVDLNHIERIILNLISNAIKFNKPNGKIEVSISTKEHIQIIIKDTGIGIPKEKVERIFQRFEQVNKHSRREREGSGIGLSLVKSLVEMHGGTIKLNSTLFEGSEFIITLPEVLVEQVNLGEVNKDNGILGRVNRMEVEFSDIYFKKIVIRRKLHSNLRLIFIF